MVSIQDAGREILSGEPGKFYVFGGLEYGVKMRYLKILSEHYNGNVVEANSVDYVLTLMSNVSLITRPDTLYIVRYDEQFLSNLSDVLVSDIASANITGTLVCIYQDKKHISKCDKYLPKYTISFDAVSPGFVRKYLTSDFPSIDPDIVDFALSVGHNYISAYNICSILAYADSAVLMRYGRDVVGHIVGSKDMFSDDRFKLAIASRSFKFAVSEIASYDGDYSLLLYSILNVLVELEKSISCPRSKSKYTKYSKSWTLDDIYQAFSMVYDWIKKARSNTPVDLKNIVVSILASLQFSPIVYVG